MTVNANISPVVTECTVIPDFVRKRKNFYSSIVFGLRLFSSLLLVKIFVYSNALWVKPVKSGKFRVR